MMDCCNTKQRWDLIILGGGSAAFSAAIKATELGAKTLMINDGLPIGGTCVNVGCVPSKTLLRAGQALHTTKRNPFSGIELTGEITDFKAMIAQKKELVGELRKTKYLDVIHDLPNITVMEGRASFVDSNTISVNGKNLQAEKIIIATGSSPYMPPIYGLENSGYLTSQTLFELEELPESLIVLGGRVIALECAQMFARFGTKVTILQRSSRILPTETEDVSLEIAKQLQSEGIRIVTDVRIESIRREGSGANISASAHGAPESFRAEHLLAALGRRPNSVGMGLENAGVKTAGDGKLLVDEELRTTSDGIYGAGDVTGEPMYVYTAAYEGKLAAENALGGLRRKRDYAGLPWVIFTDPQIAGVGMDEKQAGEAGIEAETSTLALAHLPRAIAARDTRGFIKLIREAKTKKLLGARIVAGEGSELLMEATLAIKHGITTNELAETFHPYLTLSEGVKLASIGFGKDVSKLSCCAT